jgi:KDO2-lipid IV(A) lauroyltransferase
MADAQKTAEHLGFRLLKTVFSLLPRTVCLGIGGVLGILVYGLDAKHRTIALSNLNTAYGTQISTAQKKKWARGSFIHYGRFFAEIIKYRSMKAEKIHQFISVEGTDHIKKALREGKGALLFSAHFGNWELATAMVSRLGKVNVIARPLDNRRLEEEILEIREKLGARVIHKQQAARPVLRALQENEMVAILIDQNTVRNHAVFVEFFGKQAATTPSLAAFFRKSGAPLIPVFCYPIPKNRYRLEVQPPIDVAMTGDEKQDVLKITQLCTKIIQNQIQKNPKVWLWFHDRWKTRPVEEENSGKNENER